MSAFVQKSFRALEGWYHGLLASRDWCGRCSERYLVENLTLCTHCDRLWCYRCKDDLTRHENGDQRCTCKWGGELAHPGAGGAESDEGVRAYRAPLFGILCNVKIRCVRPAVSVVT